MAVARPWEGGYEIWFAPILYIYAYPYLYRLISIVCSFTKGIESIWSMMKSLVFVAVEPVRIGYLDLGSNTCGVYLEKMNAHLHLQT